METLKGKINVGVYVPTFTETDPTVPEHVKAITQEQIEKWDSGTGGGTGGGVIEEQDPTVPEYVKSITEEDINNWNNPKIPTKTSDLTNDSNFISSIPSEYVTESELNNAISGKANLEDIPTKTSDLTNDSGFITSYTETDPTVPTHVKNITQDDINKWNSSSNAGTTDYTELTNKPKINNVELSGNKTLDDLGIQAKGNYALKSEIPSNTISSTNVTNIVSLSQTEYDGLTTKNSSTLYIIVG